MRTAHIALLILAGLTPALSFFDGAAVSGIIGLFAATALAAVMLSIRASEAGHLLNATRWVGALAGVPLVLILIQFLPLPLGALSGSIWRSAGETLDVALGSHVTIDPGLTLLALCKYSFVLAIGFAVAAVAVDRLEAERLFLVLGGATLIMALLSITYEFRSVATLEGSETSNRAASRAGSIFGIIIFANVVILLIERHLTRRTQQDIRTQFFLPLAAAATGFVICCLAVLVNGSEQAIFSAGCGLTTVVIVYFVRRIGLSWQSALWMAGAALVGAALIVSAKKDVALAHYSLRYADRILPSLIAAANRVIEEVGIGGSGAGTFQSIFRLYAADASNAPSQAPTFAGQIAIEMGRAALWLFVVETIALIALCAKGAFNRGRDLSYPLVGAGVAVSALVLAFCDSSLNNSAVEILLVSTLGIAIAQSLSRSV